jgi:acyl carrier protein
MSNREKLRRLIMDTFLLEEHEFTFELRRDQVETWDSLGIVAIGVGIKDTFGYHPTPAEAVALAGVPEIIALLRAKGYAFDD